MKFKTSDLWKFLSFCKIVILKYLSKLIILAYWHLGPSSVTAVWFSDCFPVRITTLSNDFFFHLYDLFPLLPIEINKQLS